MATRKIKDAKDLTTNELIYFKGHAKATFMSDGRTVEDAINSGGGTGDNRFFSPISVEEFYDGLSGGDIIGDATEFINAAREGKIICVPYEEGGFVVTTYKFTDGQGEDLSFLILIAFDSYKLKVSAYYTGSGYGLRIENPWYEPAGNLIVPYPNGLLVMLAEGSYSIIDEPVSHINLASLMPLYVGATVRFTTEENCTFEFLTDGADIEICWANGVLPTLEPNTTYELSMTMTYDCAKILAVLTPFKPAS